MLSNADKRRWHAQIYGFRRAILNIERHVTTSPVDPKGEWYDPLLVDDAEAHYRDELDRRARERKGSAM
jgi:hypothetical protein